MKPGKEQGSFKTTLVGDNIWSIDGPANDLMHLVVGTKKALLLDTGMGIGDLASEVKNLTELPLMVVNTHGHPDHAGGNSNFDEVWFPRADEAIMRRMTTLEYRANDVKAFHGENSPQAKRLLEALVPTKPWKLRALRHGQTFDLGGRKFEVLPLPGHTPGSIGLYNTREKILFSGDAIVSTPAWLYLEHSLPLKKYLQALRKAAERKPEFTTIYPGHQPTRQGRQLLADLIACAEEILARPGIGEPTRTFAGEGLQWVHGSGKIIYDPRKLD